MNMSKKDKEKPQQYCVTKNIEMTNDIIQQLQNMEESLEKEQDYIREEALKV